jgi:PadR family transcriptional regulator, regulatory protein PadR
MKLRRSPQTLLVLAEFLQTPRDWKYGYDISRNTELKSGTLYPILMRLADRDRALLETRWETSEAGKPPRHMYRLTVAGLQYARQELPSSSRRSRVQPAFSGVKN